jgi:hypothetical protein
MAYESAELTFGTSDGCYSPVAELLGRAESSHMSLKLNVQLPQQHTVFPSAT